jgi:hypothetical protein
MLISPPLFLLTNTHNKELLAIFESFCTWRHYLKGSLFSIDVVTDHKNLTYFATTKTLIQRQAHWSEFLSQFNLVVCFRLGRLGGKPDALTRQWDVYPKGRDSGFASINPNNTRPIFTQEQLETSLQATSLLPISLQAAELVDVQSLYNDIQSALKSNPITKNFVKGADPRWTSRNGFILLDHQIYVPDQNDL